MNIRIIFLMIAVFLIGQINSAPLDTTMFDEISMEPFTEQTITTPVPTTTIPTTTTTTTLAPEVDRDWEDLVLGGPTVVSYLGLFMVLASRGNQVLTPAPEYAVKYILNQNLQSLQATLRQVSSAMQNAFELARDDLVRVQNSMEEIPEHLKAALVVIKSVPSDSMSFLLPYTLNNLNRAANEGSTVSKPTLSRFVSVGLLLEELVTVLASTPTTIENADYFTEANAYANDIKIQWKLLEDLFQKFSERADITKGSVNNDFIDEINQALEADGFSTQIQRTTHLNKLVPIAITIDQSSYLLNMMSTTYSKISADYMANQIASSNSYIGLGTDSSRATSQRQLWQNTVSQSVNVARLAQTRHNEFIQTGPNRQSEYAIFLEPFRA